MQVGGAGSATGGTVLHGSPGADDSCRDLHVCDGCDVGRLAVLLDVAVRTIAQDAAKQAKTLRINGRHVMD